MLVLGRTPSDREIGLVALLSALDKVPDVVGPVDVPQRELKRRGKVIAEGSMAGDAVRKAVEEINAAMTAVFITMMAAGAAGASA